MKASKGRILYTEDDHDSRELNRFLFAFNSYDIVSAESGLGAVNLAKTEPCFFRGRHWQESRL
ncbi:MAG TPA: hypothetical protein VN844_17495 [Pyrinomonadaceae bacterium]|nr:hypothetical protein [Pyrinomonadaceae bacterium]